MYLSSAHVEKSIPTLRNLIHDNPLGILTTAIPSSEHPLIQSTHIPWVLDVSDPTSETELGVLRSHIARMNPQTKAMIESISKSSSPTASPGVLEQEVMILFQSPIQSYVPPEFYTHTKPSTRKVVPTWNYAAVQAYGRAKIFVDHKAAASREFLHKQIRDISAHGEKVVMGHSGEGVWEVEDAPPEYIEQISKAIMGIEITVERLQGKFKMSQEMKVEDRAGVAEGFERLGTEVGKELAGLVRERSGMKEMGRKEIEVEG